MSYIYIKRFRRKIKKAIVIAFGGVCLSCGFDEFIEAFDFHHLDAGKKEFGISQWKKLNTEKLKEEALKCVMVCSNCHRGIHLGYIKPPESTFNEDLFDKAMEKERVEKTPCLTCGKLKPIRYKYCSRPCVDNTKKVRWNEVDLEEELKSKTMSQIGRELGVSMNAVKKRAVKIGLR